MVKPSESPLYVFIVIWEIIVKYFVAVSSFDKTPIQKRYFGIGSTLIMTALLLLFIYYLYYKSIVSISPKIENIFVFFIAGLIFNIFILSFTLINYTLRTTAKGLKGPKGNIGPKGNSGDDEDCNICTRRIVRFKKEKPILPVPDSVDTSIYNMSNIDDSEKVDEVEQSKKFINNQRWKQYDVGKKLESTKSSWVRKILPENSDIVLSITRVAPYNWFRLDGWAYILWIQKETPKVIEKAKENGEIRDDAVEGEEFSEKLFIENWYKKLKKMKDERLLPKTIIFRSDGQIQFNNGPIHGNWTFNGSQFKVQFDSTDPVDNGEKTYIFSSNGKFVYGSGHDGIGINLLNYIRGAKVKLVEDTSNTVYHSESTVEFNPNDIDNHYNSTNENGELIKLTYKDAFDNKPPRSCGENCNYYVKGEFTKDDIQSGCGPNGNGQCGSYINGIILHTFGTSKLDEKSYRNAQKNEDTTSNGIGSLQFQYAKEKIEGSKIITEDKNLGKQWGDEFVSGGIYLNNSTTPTPKKPSDLFLRKYHDFTCPKNSGIYKIDTIYKPKIETNLIKNKYDNYKTLPIAQKEQYPGHLMGIKVFCKDINTGSPVQVLNEKNQSVYGKTFGLEPSLENAQKDNKIFSYTCNTKRHNNKNKPTFISGVGAYHGERVNSLGIYKCSYNYKD